MSGETFDIKMRIQEFLVKTGYTDDQARHRLVFLEEVMEEGDDEEAGEFVRLLQKWLGSL